LREEAVKNISNQEKHTLAAVFFLFFWRVLAATSVDEQKNRGSAFQHACCKNKQNR
jgi:hypothetical protein